MNTREYQAQHQFVVDSILCFLGDAGKHISLSVIDFSDTKKDISPLFATINGYNFLLYHLKKNMVFS